MTTDSSLPSGVHKEKQILLEIGNSEKQLWALIHSEGLLNYDGQELYRNIRSSYERTILNNHTHSELQDVEYSLWKLHYKHIDEFRKRIKKCSGNAENNKSGISQDGVMQMNNDNHIKAFMSFLSEATEFYQTLIVKLRKYYGVPEEALFYKKGYVSTSFEPEFMLKCQYLCHRCLVCMGDLARYKQQYENLDIQNQNWSIAASHYLEATRIWPDSGNPQNQLAVLATYIGDDFLALYHCVRSLAVKEPFPDAWDNLILLLEKNRSSHLPYVSSEFCLNFFKPSQRISKGTEARTNDNSSNYNMFESESNHFTDTKLWSFVVRTISFLFIISSSLEEFPIALASTIGVLDEMMELEDTKLKTMLVSYGQMDIARKGPFRALQVVSILIFTLKNLIDKHRRYELEDKSDSQQLVLIQLALAAAFIFMGRFVERCLKSSPLNYCPLLPSVLVFAEWCASMLDAIEVYATDQRSATAISYYFDVLVELLNQLNENRKETKKLVDSTPLWEDYELRGFVSISLSHFSLDFSGRWEYIDNFENGTELRTHRINEAALKIATRSNNFQKWITCDELGRKFYAAMSEEDHDKKETKNMESIDIRERGDDPNQKTQKDTGEDRKCGTRDNPSSSSTKEKSSLVEEEEEVILFRPLARYNSAPSNAFISFDEQISSPKDENDKISPSDDCLRRTTSLLTAQNPLQSDPWEFHGAMVNPRINKSFKLNEPSMKESNAHTFSEGLISAGPPSLNAWVLERGGSSTNRLQPIEEVASSYLADLSINRTQNSVISSVDEFSNLLSSSATYTAPIPSAPLLPDNAAWYTELQSSVSSPLFPDNPSPISAYSDWRSTYEPLGYNTNFPPYSNGYSPSNRMSSLEWLHWYRENPTPERVNINNHMLQPTHLTVPRNHENFFCHDINTYNYRFNQYDQWGNPLSPNHYTYMKPPGTTPLQPGYPYAFGVDEHMTSLFNNFQRPRPYGCGSVTEQRNEALPLLEYLKEKEWRLQQDPTLGGPTFMGK
ncbi:protein SMG7L-like isoform X2 [Abrus precatorius]|uniref:Protein SMG7L-like isoform X2 n=1 Tax=Abrus precatorius TaxID=3816 RepID=A0A8B8KRL6_ABRPR|nr:protein SMG7L-like isoform X2 [Abrus precatorius]